MPHDPLNRLCVVLYEPQDDINIGTVVRACKNFGVHDIRLIRPASADPARVLISAPRAEDVVGSLRRFDTIDEALADCALVVGTSARVRVDRRIVLDPQGGALQLVDAMAHGRAALMFGREDHGLPNEALDRCHALITFPTQPDYASLNLGQAVLLAVWEVTRALKPEAVRAPAVELVRASSEAAPATGADLDRLMAHAERVLTEIEFLKPTSHAHMVATMRRMLTQAALDDREIAIWHGIFSQVTYAINRARREARVEG